MVYLFLDWTLGMRRMIESRIQVHLHWSNMRATRQMMNWAENIMLHPGDRVLLWPTTPSNPGDMSGGDERLCLPRSVMSLRGGEEMRRTADLWAQHTQKAWAAYQTHERAHLSEFGGLS